MHQSHHQHAHRRLPATSRCNGTLSSSPPNTRPPTPTPQWDAVLKSNRDKSMSGAAGLSTNPNMQLAMLTTVDVMLLAQCDLFVGKVSSASRPCSFPRASSTRKHLYLFTSAQFCAPFAHLAAPLLLRVSICIDSSQAICSEPRTSCTPRLATALRRLNRSISRGASIGRSRPGGTGPLSARRIEKETVYSREILF